MLGNTGSEPLTDPREVPLLVGSVKGNIGHLECAAGIAALIKASLVAKTREIPRTINCATREAGGIRTDRIQNGRDPRRWDPNESEPVGSEWAGSERMGLECTGSDPMSMGSHAYAAASHAPC